MRANYRGLAHVVTPPDLKEYSVHLMGGEALRMRLEAADLTVVSERLRQERGLLGQLIVEEEGCPRSVEALVPGGRIQLVVAHEG